MGDIDINVEVDKASVEKAIRALKRGLRDGAYESAKWATREYEDTAKDTIRGRRMWNREVYHGFRKQERRTEDGAWARVRNPVQHAEIVNYGRRPGQKAPQAQHIIEWVDDKIFAAIMSDGGYSPDDDDDSHPVVSRDSDIDEVVDLESLEQSEADTSTANASELRRVYFENGESALFSPHEGIMADTGATHNEVGYHRVLEELGLKEDITESFPEAKFWTLDDDGDIKDGMMMRWSEEGAGRPIGNHLKTYMNPGNFRHVEDWLDDDEHRKFLARVGVIDYLIGNDDRHYGNILYGIGGRPIAIDNGGHTGPRGVYAMNKYRAKMLTALDVTTIPKTKDFDTGEYIIFDPDKLRNHMHDVWDRQERILQQLSDDPNLRVSLVEMMQNIHPEDSKWYDFYEEAWLDESSWRYAVFREDSEWGDREMWQRDLDWIRNQFESDYQDRLDEESTDTLHDSSDTTTEIGDDLFGDADSGILGDMNDEFDNL